MEYYCKKCKRFCDFDEIEILQHTAEDDWQEFHIVCDSRVEVIIKRMKED